MPTNRLAEFLHLVDLVDQCETEARRSADAGAYLAGCIMVAVGLEAALLVMAYLEGLPPGKQPKLADLIGTARERSIHGCESRRA